MVIALIAFIVGSAVGISVSIGEHDNQTDGNNTTHVENVTFQMTNNLNDSGNNNPYAYTADDAVDYNANTSTQTPT